MASTKSPGGVEVGRVSIKVVPDTSKFRQELIAELKAAGRGLEVEIPVRVDTKNALRSLTALQGRVDRLNNGLDTRSNISEFSRNLSEVGNNAQKAAQSFSGMGRIILIAVAALLLAAPILGLIATLLAGLPSLILAAGVAFAAIGLGMDGIKEAAKTLVPEVEKLKKSLSDTFREGLAPVFEQLKAIFPVLDRGLNAVARGLIDIVKSLTDFVTSAEGMRQIEFILSRMGQFFSDMAPVITEFFRIFLDLSEIGAANFGILVGMLSEFATGFRSMLNSLDPQVFTNAFEGLSEVLGAVLRLFTDLFEIGLKVMGDLGEPLAILINGISGLLQGLLPVLSAVSGVVSRVLGEAFAIIGRVLVELTPVLIKIVDLLGNVLLTALRVIGPVLIQVAELVANFLGEAFRQLAPLLPPLLDFFARFTTMLGETLIAALVELMPFLMTLVQFAVDFLVALTPLLPTLLDLAQNIFKAWLDIVIALAPYLADLAERLLPILLNAVVDIVPVLIDLMETFSKLIGPVTDFIILILDFVIPVILNLLSVVSDAWPAIEEIIKGVLDFISGHLKVILGLMTGDWDMAWEGIKQIARGALGVLKGAVELGLRALLHMFIDLPGSIIGALGDTGSMLFQAGRNIVQGLINGIKNMISKAGEAISSVAAKIRSYLPFSPAKEGPFSGSGYTFYSGQALIRDWAAGISSAEPVAVAAIDDAMAASQNALDLNAMVQTEGFGGLGDAVSTALAGWTVEIDANGIARLVNKVNRSNERR